MAIMQSGLTSLANFGSISGSGFAIAKIIGSLFIVLSISWVKASLTDKPRNISEPLIASAKDRASVSIACAAFHWIIFSSLPI